MLMPNFWTPSGALLPGPEFSESVGYLWDFPAERPVYRGRPDKGMVMVCR